MHPRITQFLDMIKKHRLILVIYTGLFGCIVVLGLILVAHLFIMPYGQYIERDIDQLPERDIALVFGGGMENNGEQTVMQKMRVSTAVELYKKGKVKKIMMTGDDGGVRFDETSAMVYYARMSGVPVYDILVDPHGYRTYESCYREHEVYHLDRVIAISHEFHLPRIMYLCRSFGIDTIGFSADYHGYIQTPQMATREILARVKAWWQVSVTKPLPRVST